MPKSKSKKFILKTLEEYGDSVLEESDYPPSKRSKVNDDDHDEIEPSSKDIITNSKKKKKKKRKKLRNKQESDNSDTAPKQPINKKLQWLKGALGKEHASYDLLKHAKSDHKHENVRVQKSSTSLKKKEPEVVIFNDPTKRKRKREAEKTVRTENKAEITEFDMKTARHEVRKLGVSGFDGEVKTEARVSMLIKLGAEPLRKKTYMNYKEFQMKRKAEINAKKQVNAEGNKSDVVEHKEEKYEKPKLKSKKAEITGIDGQVGHYKDGVQYIGKHLLKKLKG